MKFKEYVLGEIVDIRSSKRIYYKDYVDNGVPFYRSKEIIQKSKGLNIDNPLYISLEKFDEVKNKYGVPKSNDILLTSVGTIGIPYLVKDDDQFYFKDGNLTWFSNFSKDIVPRYLLYWFQSKVGKKAIDNIVIGSTQKALTMVQLKKVQIELPSIDVQEKIVSIIDSLDSKIELNNQMIATLEELAAALFKRWFVDFEFPDENGDPYKSSGGKMVESELGEVPEGWEVDSVFDQCFITGGGTPKTSIADYWDGDIPFYTPKDARDSLFVNNTEKHISLNGLNNSSAKLYKSNTIFITARGTVGKLNMAAKDMAMNQSCYAITSKSGNQYFIYNALSRQVERIKASSNGAVFNAITTRDFKLYKFPVPKSSEIIDSFEEKVSGLYENCKNCIFENEYLQVMRDTLLPKFLSGDVELL